MSHPNSRHTALGRWQFVRLVVEEGCTFAQAAEYSNVARSTVWEWVARWRAASDSERARLACLADRSCRPRRSPMQVSALEERRICELRASTGWGPRPLSEQAGRPHSTVHRVLQRASCSRRPAAEREAVVRYEWPCPGQLLHMDVKKFARFTEPGHKKTGDRSQRSRRAGWEYVHSMIDDYSRLAYSEICEDERAETVTEFTRRALDFYLAHGIVAERLMTDNHMSYRCSHSFAELLRSGEKVEVSNEELRTVRDAMRELNRMIDLLECGDSEKFVLTKHGQMRAVVLSVESFAQLRQTPGDRGLQVAA
jgi:hypothetical protein